MATGAWNVAHEGALPDRLTGTPRAAFLDRWIYVITVSLFILLVLLGFIPDSLTKIAAVNAGERPPFPLIMHVHAVLMGTFLVLLWTQTFLMATGRGALHRKLGLASFIVAPAMVVAGFLLAHTMYLYGWHAMLAAPASLHDELVRRIQGRDNILLVQLRVGILFSVFLLIGLRARRVDFGLHKRMMILATAMALPAGIDRILWLPTTFPNSFLASDLYTLLAVAPMFAWDVYRNRRVHRAYWIWIMINLPFALVLHGLWGTQWWHAMAPRLMQVA